MATYKHWDLDQLMANADAFDVADRIGMRVKRYGGSTYGECVSGSHKETQINHMQLFRDGCKCYSCGAAHNTYGMVKNYFQNVVGRSLDHDEICSVIAETCGGEDMYIIKPKRNGKIKKPFPLTEEELSFLNLATKSPRPRAIVSFSEYKTEKIREFCDDGYVRTEPLPPMNIYTLFRENEDAFWQIIKGKIFERIMQAQAGYKSYKSTEDKEMVQFFIEMYNKARELEAKLFPGQKKKVS